MGAMFLEGRLQFTRRGGVVHASDAFGQRVSISLEDFYAALVEALELEREIRESDSGLVVPFFDGAIRVRGTPL